MRTFAAFALAMVVAVPAFAQQGSTPVLETVFEDTEAIPGQPLSLRLTVLVPTYMPKPPVWPSFEAPNLIVRLPGRSTSPTSKSIGGESWSGITRRYLISPMIPGRFTLPAQRIVVTYADPQSNEPVTHNLMTEAVTFSGIVPEGADDLKPFIAAQSLELKQEIEGEPAKMIPGDSVRRTVVATVKGVSPMFLPPLLPAGEIEGVAAYANEPVVEEKEEKGTTGGSRVESITYVAEGGGTGKTPSLKVDWYNLQTGNVETASLDGFAISVDGPPAQQAEPRDWRAIATTALLGLLVLAIAYWLLKRLIPPLVRMVQAGYDAWLASEPYAFSLVKRAARKRDLAALLPALDEWAKRVPGSDPRNAHALKSALHEIGASRYGRQTTASKDAGWNSLQGALADARREAVRTRNEPYRLQPLNPK